MDRFTQSEESEFVKSNTALYCVSENHLGLVQADGL